jgi:hypothetical protein
MCSWSRNGRQVPLADSRDDCAVACPHTETRHLVHCLQNRFTPSDLLKDGIG